MNNKTYFEVVKWGEDRLRQAGIEEYKIDAWYLFSHCFEIDRAKFFLKTENIADNKNLLLFQEMIRQRERRKPLQQILEYQEFMGFPFYVNEHVLIPRQDTEILVEEVVREAAGKTVLDMCTGSGCILLSLSKICELKQAVGVDISEQALAVAEKNKENLNVDADFFKSDLFENVNGIFDIIISNPPYIDKEQIKKLPPEVAEYEPMSALDGGEDGLLFYRELIHDAKLYFTEKGTLFLEIGYNQGEDVCFILKEAGYHQIKMIKDLAGLDRVIRAEWVEVQNMDKEVQNV